ncbi:MAG: hypothetical protein KME55_05155 [Nostoc indistinguendum CM1-VF10]|jgi:hypothetical protein|nr:hypothetical protein [Nostoc indistinguendum CM1-VF10]
MTATFIKVPKFRATQWVSFIGGEGIVRSYTPESGTWTYLIEMALGLEPDFGRVGAETMILLTEEDLHLTYIASEGNVTLKRFEALYNLK